MPTHPLFYYRGIENRFEKKEGIKDAQPPAGLWLIFSKDPPALPQKKRSQKQATEETYLSFYLSICLSLYIYFIYANEEKCE